MLNKLIISGTVTEQPEKYSLGENIFKVKVKNTTAIRLSQSQKRTVETKHTICIPAFLIPDNLCEGDKVYVECSNIPALSLGKDQRADLIWANVVHLTTSNIPISNAV